MYALLKALALPPAAAFVPLLLGAVLFLVGMRRLAGVSVSLGVVLLYLVSIPAVSHALLGALEDEALRPDPSGAPQAIVILSAGVERNPPEFGGPAVDGMTLERLRAGAALHRETGLPILVSGGRISDGETSVAALMGEALERDFRVRVQWVEGQARDTWENALYSAALLKEAGIAEAYVVTHAFHMKRARESFRAAGLRPVGVPAAFLAGAPEGSRAFVPSASATLDTFYAVHEMLGLFWYRMAYFD